MSKLNPNAKPYSINESPLCHANGCCKSTNLNEQFNGLFCVKHAYTLAGIRSRLTKAKYSNDLQTELKERENEINFRKILDPGHLYYYQSLKG